MRSKKTIEETIRTKLNLTFDPPLRGQLLARALREQEQSQEAVQAFASPKTRRLIMSFSVRNSRVAAVIAVVIGLGAISVVGVNIGKIYYRGLSADGTHHVFYSKGPSGDGFTVMDANGVTAEQAQKDLEEIQNLSQQGKRELLKVKETIIGPYRLKTHEYRYQFSDGRTGEMGEPAPGMPVYSQEQWREFSPQLAESRRLRDSGPGEDLGTYEETVEGRVFSFKRERYVLSDGTEVIWSVGLLKGDQ